MSAFGVAAAALARRGNMSMSSDVLGPILFSGAAPPTTLSGFRPAARCLSSSFCSLLSGMDCPLDPLGQAARLHVALVAKLARRRQSDAGRWIVELANIPKAHGAVEPERLVIEGFPVVHFGLLRDLRIHPRSIAREGRRRR